MTAIVSRSELFKRHWFCNRLCTKSSLEPMTALLPTHMALGPIDITFASCLWPCVHCMPLRDGPATTVISVPVDVPAPEGARS